MKYILLPFVLITAALVAKPEPTAQPDPVTAAKLAVNEQIVRKIQPARPTFSRAGPRRPSASFSPTQLADGEERIPFTIQELISKEPKTVSGYVRLTDRKIFLLNPQTGKYHPASEDPRFAPQAAPSKDPKPRT
jgi:hypothetical protein